MNILTNERIVIIKRKIYERLLKITNESSVALDDIVMIKYGRAPFNKNGLYFSNSSFVTILFVLILQNLYNADLIIETPIIIIIVSNIVLYLLWIGLRLTKRSLELTILGVIDSIGIGIFITWVNTKLVFN